MKRVRGYIRLSRADVKKGDTLANHVEILQYLARQHDLPLTEEAIETEIESGGKLDTREKLQAILSECRAGMVSHLLVYDVARLSRGQESDWGEIKRALHAGRVTLVTPRDRFEFNDQLDTTMLDIEAVLARRYRHEYSLRRKAHNESRARKGIRSSGKAAYGYRWDGQAKTHVPVPEEYAIVEEIFRRIQSETSVQIAHDLTHRYQSTGNPVPPGGGKEWTSNRIHKFLKNPIYCGRPALRTTIDRYGHAKTRKREDWVMADEEQEYPHPISPPDWEALLLTISTRKWSDGKPNITGYARHFTKCCKGRPMYAYGETCYCCRCCDHLGEKHTGWHVAQSKIHWLIEEYLEELFAAMKPGALPFTGTSDTTALKRELHAAMLEVEKAKRNTRNITENLEMMTGIFGADSIREKLQDAAQSEAKAQARLQSAQSALDAASATIPTDVVESVRRMGFAAVWESLDHVEKRTVAQSCIREIVVPETDGPRFQVKTATLIPQDWAERVVPGGERKLWHWKTRAANKRLAQ